MKTLSLVIFCLAPFWLCGQADNLTKEIAAQRSLRLHEIDYDLHFQFKAGENQYKATAIIGFLDREPEKDLRLDFAVQQVVKIKVNDHPWTDFQYQPGTTLIIIPADYLADSKNTILIEYIANFSSNGSGFHRFLDPEDFTEYCYTDLQPYRAHHVFPCFDQPDLRATFQLKVTMPKPWTAMANGSIVENRYVKDQRQVTFQTTPAIATYLFNLTLGDFAEWTSLAGSVPMRLLCRQSQAEYLDADGIFAVTNKGLAFYSDYFDIEYPFAKYDQAFVPEYNAGAMENVSAVILNESLNMGFQVPESLLALRDTVILHEIAHHWFGNLVSLKWWDDLWLNESFASYMELLGMKSLGYQAPWVGVVENKTMVYRADGLSTSHPVVVPIADTKAAEANFDEITYTKGMAALRQLDYSLGGTVFRDALRDYLRTHAWQSTTIEDFLAAMKRQAKSDLTTWISAWLYDRGANQARLEWDVADGKITKAVMIQSPGSGSGQLRAHTTLLGLFKANAEKGAALDQAIRVTYQAKQTPLPQLIGLPAPDFILPNWQEYDYVTSELDSKSLAWLLEHMPEIDDPGVRSQTWQLLTQLVRAGKLSVVSYLNLAFIDLQARNQGEALRLSLDYTLDAMAHYLPGKPNFQAVRTQFFDFAKAKLETKQGDFQWRFLMFILMREAAYSDVQLGFLFKLLQDEASLKGWELDDEDRLSLLKKLMAHQFGEAKPLFVDFAKSANDDDPQVLQLLASCPLTETKAIAWRRIFAKDDLSLEKKRNLMDDFFTPGQHKITKAYIAKFFIQLEKIYTSGAWPLPRDLATSMFPHSGGKTTLKAAKRFLKQPHLPKVLRNLIQAEMEVLEKHLEIQAKNRTMPFPTGR